MSATLLPDSSSFTGVFNGLANSPAANDQALGISSLILQGNAEGYAKLAANPSLRRSPEGVALFSGVLCAAPSDKVQVAVVASLLEEVPLARCASYLLRANHSKETLPHLAKLLDHTLKEMRYEGLMGLAAFANNFPMMTPANQASMAWKTPLQPAPYSTAETRANMPTPNTFAAREGRYINFWKGWWQQHETELTK